MIALDHYEATRIVRSVGRRRAGLSGNYDQMSTMMRVRLKADGRIVEVLPDGSERPIRLGSADMPARPNAIAGTEAAYARSVRARTNLTQAQFAAQIGVPIDTVRNWEQGKRSPRGSARALLKVIEKAPEVAFAVLGTDDRGQTTEDGK